MKRGVLDSNKTSLCKVHNVKLLHKINCEEACSTHACALIISSGTDPLGFSPPPIQNGRTLKYLLN